MTTTTTTIPAPFTTTEGKDWQGKPDRTITSIWHTGETCEDLGETGEWQVRVVTSHYGNQKAFVVRIDVVQQYARHYLAELTARSDAAPYSERFHAEPAPRYSAKALRELHARMVAHVTAGNLDGRAAVIAARITA